MVLRKQLEYFLSGPRCLLPGGCRHILTQVNAVAGGSSVGDSGACYQQWQIMTQLTDVCWKTKVMPILVQPWFPWQSDVKIPKIMHICCYWKYSDRSRCSQSCAICKKYFIGVSHLASRPANSSCQKNHKAFFLCIKHVTASICIVMHLDQPNSVATPPVQPPAAISPSGVSKPHPSI